MILSMALIMLGCLITLVGAGVFIAGLAVSILGFPFGVVLGLPITLVGGVIVGAGVSIMTAAAARE